MFIAAWVLERKPNLTRTYPNVFAAWLTYAFLLAGFAMAAGYGFAGRFSGPLIDDRNKMSLSRFQLLLWTLIVVPAFLAIAAARVLEHDLDPLKIAVPSEVWTLLGISTGAFVGSPIIQAYKTGQAPSAHQITEYEARTGLAYESQNGLLDVKAAPKDATWTDLFSGEEVGDFKFLDVGKVQMFFFTLVIAGAYAAAIGDALWRLGAAATFPSVDQSMIALLGISQAGFLTNQAVPHSQIA